MHTKAAANNILPQLQKHYNTTLRVVRIAENDYLDAAAAMMQLVQCLEEKKLVDSKNTTFCLGSTRLFIQHTSWKSDDPILVCYETNDIIQRALKKKQTFGDIDIDLEFKDTASNIVKFLNEASPAKYVAKAAGCEINTAVALDDSRVIQIDLVNMNSGREAIEFNQFSSYIDLSYGLKGLVRDALVRTCAKVTIIDNKTIHVVQKLVKQNEEKIREVCKWKEGDQILFDRVRWSLAHEGLKLLVIFRKVKNGKELKTPYKVEVRNLFVNSINSSSLTDFVPFTDLNKIALMIGFSSGDVLFHAVLMLKEIERFTISEKQAIWDEMKTIIDSKRPTKTAGGQMSDKEANFTMKYLKSYMKGIDYD